MKKALILTAAGCFCSTFNLVLFGINFLPDWLGYLLFALGITLVERGTAGKPDNPSYLAWTLAIVELVMLVLTPTGFFASAISGLFAIAEVLTYILAVGPVSAAAGIDLERQQHTLSVLGTVSALGYVVTLAWQIGLLGILAIFVGVAMKLYFLLAILGLALRALSEK